MQSACCCCSSSFDSALEAHLLQRNGVLLEVLVVLQLVVSGRPRLVWGSVVLLVVKVGISRFESGADGVASVHPGEWPVVWSPVVHGSWLEVVQVGEGS